MALMEEVRQCAPEGSLNVEVLLRDKFVEHVLDSALRQELKRLIRRQPTATLLDVRGEGIRWERDGFPGRHGIVVTLFHLCMVCSIGCRAVLGRPLRLLHVILNLVRTGTARSTHPNCCFNAVFHVFISVFPHWTSYLPSLPPAWSYFLGL